jgi:hypothetical protein
MMQRRKRGRLAAIPITAIGVVVAVIALMAPPASAATGSGAGTGVWTYTGRGTSSNPPCALFRHTTYTGQDVGTYTSSTGATYAGPVTLSLTVTQDFYGNPLGDGYTNAQCSGLPGAVPIYIASGSSSGASVNSGVNCIYSSGSYSRVGNVATVQLDGNCTITTSVVVGGTKVSRTSTTPTTEVRTHEINVCVLQPDGTPPPMSCNDTNQFVAAA